MVTWIVDTYPIAVFHQEIYKNHIYIYIDRLSISCLRHTIYIYIYVYTYVSLDISHTYIISLDNRYPRFIIYSCHHHHHRHRHRHRHHHNITIYIYIYTHIYIYIYTCVWLDSLRSTIKIGQLREVWRGGARRGVCAPRGGRGWKIPELYIDMAEKWWISWDFFVGQSSVNEGFFKSEHHL